MNILNLQTGEPFDPAPRLHHKDASDGPSSAPFGRRNLVGLMGVMMGGDGNKEEEMYKELFENMVMGWYQSRGGEKVGDISDNTITRVRQYAFQHCGVGNVNMPNCTTLEGYAFYGAWNGIVDPVTVNLPSVVSILGDMSVQGLPAESTVCLDSLPTMSQRIFTGSSKNIIWHLPKVTSVTSSTWNYASTWKELHLDSMTCDDVMASTGWPWNPSSNTNTKCFCKDGYITKDDGVWTKHLN